MTEKKQRIKSEIYYKSNKANENEVTYFEALG